MKSSFTHTCLRVLNLERSIEFYENALGLKVTRQHDFPEQKFTLAYLGDGETGFELELTYNYDRTEPYALGDGYSHLAVLVDNLKETHDRHRQMGYAITELKGLDKVASYYFITDPDGYRTEVIQKR